MVWNYKTAKLQRKYLKYQVNIEIFLSKNNLQMHDYQA